MVNLQVRERLPEGAVILDNQAYDASIIGVTLDGRAIYEYGSMVQEHMTDNECNEDEAVDWIDYNTLRALPYFGPRTPIVVQALTDR